MSYWTTIYRSAWVALGFLCAVGVVCLFWPPYRQYQEYQRRQAQLEEETRLQEELLNRLKQNQERFRTDPRFVERIAHDMGMAHPDEMIFKFEEDVPKSYD